MRQKETLKRILENLLNQKPQKGYYTREDIEKAIIQERGVDKRTIKAWSNALFRFDYIIQPNYGIFNINFSKVTELELDVKMPKQIDKNQKHLTGFFEETARSHTNSSGGT